MKGAIVVGDDFPTQGGGSGGDGGSGEGGDGQSGGGGAGAANQLALGTLAVMLILGLLSPILFLFIARRRMGETRPRP